MRKNPGTSPLGRITLLLDESQRLRYENPAEVVSLCELAFQAALRLDPGAHASGIVADCRAKAAAELANAYRIADRLDAANAMAGTAFRWWREGSRDPRLLIQVAGYTASLLCHLRLFPEAFELLDAEHRFWEAWGDAHAAGRTLVVRGLYTGYAGDPQAALGILCRSLELIDTRRDPALTLSAAHNLLWFMTELGLFPLAARQLSALRVLYEEDGSRLNLLRLNWLEARLEAGFLHTDAAEHRFREVRAGFMAAGLGFPAGLVSLDLALLLLGEGRFAEIEEIARELIDLFRGLGISREAVMALVLVADASKRGQAGPLEASIRAAALLLREPELAPKRRV